jgi:hypothetical protein
MNKYVYIYQKFILNNQCKYYHKVISGSTIQLHFRVYFTFLRIKLFTVR